MTRPIEVIITADDQASPKLEKVRDELADVASAAGAVKAAGEGAFDGVSADSTQAATALQHVQDEMTDVTTAASQVKAASAHSLDGVSQDGAQAATALGKLHAELRAVVGVYTAIKGLQGTAQLFGDLAATADAFNNLAARMRIVTGEGAAFDTAMAGVVRTAVETRTSLEDTATLFTKLAEAGRVLGQGQAEALALTNTINQAIQVSGASATASGAAIVQLVQALQSGVLRGDEFNSVMENAPRLAKALADGLGVGTGELRKMAEQGQLTATAVITALQSQSSAVAAEFAKLPPTVGAALQNLNTAWTVYVGEVDKATGASAAAAQAIGYLASNLKTIAGLLVDVGQAAAGFTALRLAQHFAGIGTAAATTATAVQATTTAIQSTGVAAATSAAAVGRFAGLLATLRTFSLVGLVVNFKDIGTWIGEGIAKLAGYKDKTAELLAQEKAQQAQIQRNVELRAQQAAADKAAEMALLGLTKRGGELLAKFGEMTAAGRTASDAVNQIGKDFDLSQLPGIRDASAVLNALVQRGQISASQFQEAWADALKGEDLGVFETKAKTAFSGVHADALRLAQVTDQVLREAVRRVGPEYEALAGVTSKASTAAVNNTEAMINGLDRLRLQGVNVAAALTASLGKGIDTANTQQAIDAVRGQIERVRSALGDKVADGLLQQAQAKADALRQSLEAATPGVQSLAEALRGLGVVSDESLKKAAADSLALFEGVKAAGGSARETADAFRKYAADAIAANGGVANEALKVQAAMQGLQIQTDATGRSFVGGMAQGQSAAGRMGEAVGGVTERLKAQADMLDRINMKYMQSSHYSENQIALLEKELAARERVNAVREKELELEAKRRNVDKEGFSLNTNGQRIQQTVETENSLFNQLVSGGMDAATADRMAKQLFQQYQVWAKGTGGMGTSPSAGSAPQWLSQPFQNLVNAELQRYKVQQATQSARQQAPASASTQVAKTYNVSMGGRTVRTASDQDARNLMDMLEMARRSA